MSLFSGAKSQSRSEQHDALAVMLFCGGALPPFLLSYGKKPYSHTMLGYYHTILATVIRFSGTGIRCWVTTIRYSATGIRFSFHRIPVAHGEQEVEGPKGPAEWLTRIRCLPGNAVKSGPKAKKVTMAKRHENTTKTQKLAKSSCVFGAPGAIRTRGVTLRSSKKGVMSEFVRVR